MRCELAVFVMSVCLVSVSSAGEAPTDRNMMKQHLLGRVNAAYERWQADFDRRQTPEAIAEYQERVRAKFLEAIGGLPERTPLEPKIVGTFQGEGYRVEKVLFESQPKHYVAAAIFLPDPEKHKPPYPGVLVPCGHSANGKAYHPYQEACALLALNGMAALIFDPVDQGERHQLLDAAGKPRLASCTGHNMIGVGSILLGRNTARFEIWDGIRGVDYLQSRSEIDSKRIGCMGNSGGGTQTAYLMALDERILAASPSCYICGLYGRLLRTNGAQDAEQNIFGQLAFGMDHADYCMLRAPRPTLLCTATSDFFDIRDAWVTFRYAKRLYGRLGFAERMSLVETDQPHGYTPRLREGATRWMARWLLGNDEPISEPPGLKVLTDAEIRCTPRGEVMLLEGARSVYDLNRDYEQQLAEQRKQLWAVQAREEMLGRVRQIAGIRPLSDLPRPEVEKTGTITHDGYRIEKLVFKPESDLWLPAVLFVPEGVAPRGVVVYVDERGKDAESGPDGEIEKLVKAGRVVLAVDLRGTGETQQVGQKYFSPPLFGPDGQDFYVAYLLGRSYVGMRAEDLLLVSRWLGREYPSARAAGVDLVAVGHVTVPALHAAAVEPGLFESVKLVRPLVSWSNVVHSGYAKVPLVSLVHGALKTYDLPDLAATLDKKLSIEQPIDALGQPIDDNK